MTADATSAAARPDPAKPRAAMAHPPRQHRRGGHANCGPGTPTRTDPDQGCGNPVVTDLVTRARNADKHAWDALVERYAPLIWSICRSYQLASAGADDVGQSVWLRLVDQLDKLRDPAALPGWLATTTRRECLRVLHAMRGPQTARYDPTTEILPNGQPETAEQELLAAERHAALHEAFLTLPPRGQQLIALLIQDPLVPYAEISAKLDIPVGSIGPSRRRYLDKLRRHPAIVALINARAETPPSLLSP
jgi:RNA polymerase sigma factor (sigma-70 family)